MEHRSNARQNLNLSGHLSWKADEYDVFILDISIGGAKIDVPQASLEKGAHICLNLPALPHLEGMIVWTSGSTCGVQFDGDQDKVGDFIYNLAVYGT